MVTRRVHEKNSLREKSLISSHSLPIFNYPDEMCYVSAPPSSGTRWRIERNLFYLSSQTFEESQKPYKESERVRLMSIEGEQIQRNLLMLIVGGSPLSHLVIIITSRLSLQCVTDRGAIIIMITINIFETSERRCLHLYLFLYRLRRKTWPLWLLSCLW